MWASRGVGNGGEKAAELVASTRRDATGLGHAQDEMAGREERTILRGCYW